MNFQDFKKIFAKFWQSDDGKISLIRDIVVALIAVFIIIMILWSYTGQWFATPMVAIESGSMMHEDEAFGRIGYIDAGDMVLLVKVYKKDDIIAHGSVYGGAVAIKDPNMFLYGDYGDVIVYKKYGRDDEDQIIHRAMCWIEYNEKYNTYSVSEYAIRNESSVTIDDLGLKNYKPKSSGFITQGDNPLTNPTCDQVGGICSVPIKLEWISGKAACELPWIGTINLLFNDFITGAFWDDSKEITIYNVPGDSTFCLAIVIIVLVSIPASLDLYDYFRSKKKK